MSINGVENIATVVKNKMNKNMYPEVVVLERTNLKRGILNAKGKIQSKRITTRK